MAEPIVIGWGQNKFVKDSNTIGITLYKNSESGGSDPQSLRQNGSVYQVPANKHFILLSLTFIGSSMNTYGNGRFYFGPTANSIAGATLFSFLNFEANTTGQADNKINIDMYVDIPENNYITYNSGDSNSTVSIVGVELDA